MLNDVSVVGLDPVLNEARRTEDVRFSPGGRTLAVVETSGFIHLFRIDPASRPVRIERHALIASSGLAAPHGVDFLGEDLLVVANRGGWASFFRIPRPADWQPRMTLDPVFELGAPWFGAKGSTRKSGDRTVNCGPGSVRVRGRRLYFCCNNQHTVSEHVLRAGWRGLSAGDARILLQDGLEIPDGLALSRDGRWLAVGEHNHRLITVHDANTLAVRSVLRDPFLQHPHGLCFDPTGKVLYVADAGERALHVFVSEQDWSIPMEHSSYSLEAVSADAFERTKESVEARYRPLEGGIKGIDVDASGRLLATTCQNQILRFFESSWVAPRNPVGRWMDRWSRTLRDASQHRQGVGRADA